MSLNPNPPAFRCNDCKFFASMIDDKGAHGSHGQCRRNAPYGGDTYGSALWPMVTVTEWCGDGRAYAAQVAA
tara:strand:- start:9412 stop:9627 length:216 start_codon:yes stop_codon:yes gene_type:complete